MGVGAATARHGEIGAAVADRSQSPLVAQSGVLLVLGLHRLLRALAHLADPDHRRHRDLRRQVLNDVLLALIWVSVGIALTWCAARGASPLTVAGAGALASAVLLERATAISFDIARLQKYHGVAGSRAWLAGTRIGRRWRERSTHGDVLSASRRFHEGFERREALGQITGHLGRTLVLLACVLTAFVGVAGAQVASRLMERRIDQSRTDPDPKDMPTTYAGHCPALPDPQSIGQGLGSLFRHDGAVQAGCGSRARAVTDDGSVWISEGICGQELRSLAVASPSGTVLLYGEAARLARVFADVGVLRFAERSAVAGGEVVVIATSDGSYVLARVTPSLRAGRGRAASCQQVTDIARPFAILPPPLAAMWQTQVRTSGWSWPVRNASAGPRSFAFIGHAARATVAYAHCATALTCMLWHGRDRTTLTGFPTVTLADLLPYAP